MRKINFQNIYNINIYIVYIIINILYYTGVFNFTFKFFWFVSFLFFVSIMLLIKSVIFKSDSTLWFSLSLFLIGVFFVINNFYKINLLRDFWIGFFIVSICCLLVGIFFRQWLLIKGFLLNFSVFVPSFLFSLKLLSVWWFLALILLCFLICFYILYVVNSFLIRVNDE